MPKIIVSISKDGRTQVKTEGVSGSNCISVTEALEKRLGHIESIDHTPEFYVEPVITEQEVRLN